jgi:hypothetical protein
VNRPLTFPTPVEELEEGQASTRDEEEGLGQRLDGDKSKRSENGEGKEKEKEEIEEDIVMDVDERNLDKDVVEEDMMGGFGDFGERGPGGAAALFTQIRPGNAASHVGVHGVRFVEAPVDPGRSPGHEESREEKGVADESDDQGQDRILGQIQGRPRHGGDGGEDHRGGRGGSGQGNNSGGRSGSEIDAAAPVASRGRSPGHKGSREEKGASAEGDHGQGQHYHGGHRSGRRGGGPYHRGGGRGGGRQHQQGGLGGSFVEDCVVDAGRDQDQGDPDPARLHGYICNFPSYGMGRGEFVTVRCGDSKVFKIRLDGQEKGTLLRDAIVSFIPTHEQVFSAGQDGHHVYPVGKDPVVLKKAEAPHLIISATVKSYNARTGRGELDIFKDQHSRRARDGTLEEYTKRFRITELQAQAPENLCAGMLVRISTYQGPAVPMPPLGRRMLFPIVGAIEEDHDAVERSYVYNMVMPRSLVDMFKTHHGANFFIGDCPDHLDDTAHFPAHWEARLREGDRLGPEALEKMILLAKQQYVESPQGAVGHWAVGERLFRYVKEGQEKLRIVINPLNFRVLWDPGTWEVLAENLLKGPMGPSIESIHVLKILDDRSDVGNFLKINAWHDHLGKPNSYVSRHCTGLGLIREPVYFNFRGCIGGQPVMSEGRSERARTVGILTMTAEQRTLEEEIHSYTRSGTVAGGARSEIGHAMPLGESVLVATHQADAGSKEVKTRERMHGFKGERRDGSIRGCKTFFVRASNPNEVDEVLSSFLEGERNGSPSLFWAMPAKTFFSPTEEEAEKGEEDEVMGCSSRMIRIVHTGAMHPCMLQATLGEVPAIPISQNVLMVDIGFGGLTAEVVVDRLRADNAARAQQGIPPAYKAVSESATSLTVLCGMEEQTTSVGKQKGSWGGGVNMGGREGFLYVGGLDPMLPEEVLRAALAALGIVTVASGRDKETRWVWGPRYTYGELGAVFIRVWVPNTEDFPANTSAQLGSREVVIAALSEEGITKLGEKLFEGGGEEMEVQEAVEAKAQEQEQARVRALAAMHRSVLTGTKGARPLFVSLGRQRAEEAATKDKAEKEARRKEREGQREKEKQDQDASDTVLAKQLEEEDRKEKEKEGREAKEKWEEAQTRNKARHKRRVGRGGAQDPAPHSPVQSGGNSFAALAQRESGTEDEEEKDGEEEEEAEPKARGKGKGKEKSKVGDKDKSASPRKVQPKAKTKPRSSEKTTSTVPVTKKTASGWKAPEASSPTGRRHSTGSSGGGKTGGGAGAPLQGVPAANERRRQREEHESPRKGERKKDPRTTRKGNTPQQRSGQDGGRGIEAPKGRNAHRDQGGSARGRPRERLDKESSGSGGDESGGSRGSSLSMQESDQGSRDRKSASPGSGGDSDYNPRKTAATVSAKSTGLHGNNRGKLANYGFTSAPGSRAGSQPASRAGSPQPGSLSATSALPLPSKRPRSRSPTLPSPSL